MTRTFTKVFAVSLALLPLAALASQPEVKFTDLSSKPAAVTAQPGFDFFLNPDKASELRIKLPRSINEFDIDSDPFATAKV